LKLLEILAPLVEQIVIGVLLVDNKVVLLLYECDPLFGLGSFHFFNPWGLLCHYGNVIFIGINDAGIFVIIFKRQIFFLLDFHYFILNDLILEGFYHFFVGVEVFEVTHREGPSVRVR